MNTIVNARDLQVKTNVKAVVLETADYKKMYSNVMKRENALRIKFYDVNATGTVGEIVDKIKDLGLGKVEKLGTGTFGLKRKPIWSIVVTVDAENIQ